MAYKLEVYGSLCATALFDVNGVAADKNDFGAQYDRSPETAEDYACGDMRFTRIPPTDDVLDKYCITRDEYEAIAAELEDKLSFGNCGWCQ